MSLSISYSFSPTTTIESGQVNQNFSDIVTYINGTVCVTNMVMGWKGAIVDIPTGWVIDNDLKDRMIIGAGNLYNVAATGGSTTKNLSHTHTGPSHTHVVSGNTTAGATSSTSITHGDNDAAAESHQHAISITSAAGGTGNTGSSGSATQDIMPPYYALAYIRKS